MIPGEERSLRSESVPPTTHNAGAGGTEGRFVGVVMVAEGEARV